MKQIKGIKRQEQANKRRYGMKVGSKSVFLIQEIQNKRKAELEGRA